MNRNGVVTSELKEIGKVYFKAFLHQNVTVIFYEFRYDASKAALKHMTEEFVLALTLII